MLPYPREINNEGERLFSKLCNGKVELQVARVRDACGMKVSRAKWSKNESFVWYYSGAH